MPGSDSINRRQFLEKTSLLGAAATAAVGARKASAQINNAAGLSVEPVRLGFIGVGIRGTLLMEAAAGIAGAEVKVAADCYQGHLDAARELIAPAPEVTGNYEEILSRPDVDAGSDGHIDSDTHPNTHACTDGYPDPDRDAHTHGHADTHAQPDADSESDAVAGAGRARDPRATPRGSGGDGRVLGRHRPRRPRRSR